MNGSHYIEDIQWQIYYEKMQLIWYILKAFTFVARYTYHPFRVAVLQSKKKNRQILWQNPANISMLFNFFLWLRWRRDVVQPHINVETSSHISTLEFTILNNVESILCISKLLWATLDNVDTTLSFQRWVSQRLSRWKQLCENDNF